MTKAFDQTDREGDLHAKVRAAMERGVLPARPPVRWSGGAATGTTCAACQAPTTFGDIELELEFSVDPASVATYRVHPRCFRVYLIELARPPQKAG